MKDQGNAKRFMTVAEVAAYFALSREYVYKLVQFGRLDAWHPEKKIGAKGLRISVESVRRFEEDGLLDSG